MLLNQITPRLWRYGPAALAAGVGLIASLLAFEATWSTSLKTADILLQADVANRHRRLIESIGNYEYVINAVRFYAEGSVGRHSEKDFDAVIAPLFAHHEGIQFLDYVPRVLAADRTAFETAMRRSGHPEFQIFDRRQDGEKAPAGERDEYFPIRDTAIRNIGPVQDRESYLGLDIGPERRELLARARDTGSPAATGPVPLSQDLGAQRGITFAAPVYRTALGTDTIEKRRAALIGFAIATFRLDDFFAAILREVGQPRGFDQYVFYGDAAEQEHLVYVNGSRLRPPGERVPLFSAAMVRPEFALRFSLADQQWIVAAVPLASAHLRGPDSRAMMTLIAGLLATALLVAFLISAIRRAKVMAAVTGDLKQTTSRLSGGIEEHKRLLERLAKVSMIVENSPTVVASLRFPESSEASPVTEYVSANFTRFGYTADDLMSGGVDFFRDIIHKDDQARVITRLHDAIAAGLIDDGTDFRVIRRDGAVRWAEGRVTFKRDTAGRVYAGDAVLRDITERKEAEQKLQFANMILVTTMETSLDAILVIDENNRIISFNRRFVEMWNIPKEIVDAGEDEPVLAMLTSRMVDPSSFIARVRYLYDHPAEASHDELSTADGRSVARYSSALKGPEVGYLGRVWFFRDVTDRKRAEGQILQMARYDSLTGLANRRVFVERIEQTIAQETRGGAGFAVLYLDLDHFKDVNDTLGHPIGDELLRAFGERLSSNVRDNDTVARFGGDEFAVLAANMSSPTDAGMLATKILQIASEPYQIRGNSIQTGASIGISVYGPEASNAETLLSHADLALYRAKSQQRGTFRFFTDEMDDEVRSRVTLAAELREAIAQDQLFLMYQPQIEVDTGRILGLEALIRWRHPRRGVLLPADFIAVAEWSGLVVVLGRWVMKEACRQAKRWVDEGIAPKWTAVNLSALQFKAPLELERDIDAILNEVGLPRSFLEFELTETALMETSREHNDVLQRLHQSGISLAIDDFGTGYSSLDYLRRFPVDRLKIAQNFISRITDNAGDAAIVKASISLARELNIRVIAEGVATAEQFKLLKRWGCEQAQGYFFSEPLSAEQITHVLRQAVPFWAIDHADAFKPRTSNALRSKSGPKKSSTKTAA